MKTFKNVLKILMIVIFIISAAFNIMILGNTYGTLVFKYDEEKLLSMASTSTLNFMPTYFLTEVESGFQITKEVTENDKTDKNTYDFYFDKESNLTAKIYSSEQTGDSYKKNTSYYKDGTLFQDIDGVKSKVTSTPQSITNEILTELFTLQNGLVSDIEDTDNKSMVGFSLKPFYVIGISNTVCSSTSSLVKAFSSKIPCGDA